MDTSIDLKVELKKILQRIHSKDFRLNMTRLSNECFGSPDYVKNLLKANVTCNPGRFQKAILDLLEFEKSVKDYSRFTPESLAEEVKSLLQKHELSYRRVSVEMHWNTNYVGMLMHKYRLRALLDVYDYLIENYEESDTVLVPHGLELSCKG